MSANLDSKEIKKNYHKQMKIYHFQKMGEALLDDKPFNTLRYNVNYALAIYHDLKSANKKSERLLDYVDLICC